MSDEKYHLMTLEMIETLETFDGFNQWWRNLSGEEQLSTAVTLKNKLKEVDQQ